MLDIINTIGEYIFGFIYAHNIHINICCIIVLFLYDYFVARKRNGRWFNVHAFGNLIVTLSSLPAVIMALRDPINIMNTDIWPYTGTFGITTAIPTCTINALHIYHMIAFNDLTSQDYFHHLLFIPLVGFVSQYYAMSVGLVTNYNCFFISGLPGGISYFMLYLMKNNKLNRLTEKKWTTFLNKWIRCPFILYCSFMQYMTIIYGLNSIPLLFNVLIMILNAFNCIHYNAEAIESYTRYKIKNDEENEQ